MLVLEGMYGTSRSSYLTLEGKNGRTRMIVRHSQKVDESKAGARSRFVESILIENPVGERMLFPTTGLAPARAMTQHINMGGGFADLVGQQITRMAQDFSNLGACSSYVSNNIENLSEGANAVREGCRSKIREMKKVFERMYRSENGYMTEAKKLEDDARTLNETDTTETVPVEKINELRKTLNLENSNYLSDAVFESVCKLCKECTGDESVTEAKEDDVPTKKDGEDYKPKAGTTVSVLGRQVNTEAWDKLKKGEIDLFGKPKMGDVHGDEANPEGYTSRSGELLAKLASIVPVVQDDSLMNLLAFVADRMPEERDPAVAKKMRQLAMFVVKAAGMSMNEGIADNAIVREFNDWISRFETKRKLREMSDPFSPDAYTDGPNTESAIEKASSDFMPEEFMESTEGKELIRFMKPHRESAEDGIPMADVKSALMGFFTHWIETHTGEIIEDTDQLADEKMSEVIAYLAREGYVVTGDDEQEPEIEEDDLGMDMADDGSTRQILDDDMMDETMGDMDECELTAEDVLLPNPNQGDSLAREVTPRTVKDPDTGKDTAPDSAYVSRLRTLSGITSPNRQF